MIQARASGVMRGGRPARGKSSTARRGPKANAFLTQRITVGSGIPKVRAMAGQLVPSA